MKPKIEFSIPLQIFGEAAYIKKKDEWAPKPDQETALAELVNNWMQTLGLINVEPDHLLGEIHEVYFAYRRKLQNREVFPEVDLHFKDMIAYALDHWATYLLNTYGEKRPLRVTASSSSIDFFFHPYQTFTVNEEIDL